MKAGDLNAYYCEKCRRYVVTIDLVDDGVTPMFLSCRATPGCGGRMHSMMYPSQPWPECDGNGRRIPTEPTFEWYRPEGAELKRMEKAARRGDAHALGALEHVRKGGLLLRERDTNVSHSGADGDAE